MIIKYKLRKVLRGLFIVNFFLFSVNYLISQTTYYVNDNSTSNDSFCSSAFDGSGNGSTSDPFGTISSALAAASAGDIIKVDAGTYDESNIDISKTITITGLSESLTIIDNNDVSGEYCFKVTSVGSDVTIENMTIRDLKVVLGVHFIHIKWITKSYLTVSPLIVVILIQDQHTMVSYLFIMIPMLQP